MLCIHQGGQNLCLIGGFRERVGGVATPIWSENFTKKVIFLPFLGLHPTPLCTEWWTKVVMRSCNPLKILDPPMYLHDGQRVEVTVALIGDFGHIHFILALLPSLVQGFIGRDR